MSKNKLHKILMIFLILLASTSFLLAIYFLPPVHERLSWRVNSLRSDIYYLFNPPVEVVFIPRQQSDGGETVNLTQTELAFEPTATLEPTIAPTDFVSPTPTQTATPTPSPTPVPGAWRLEDQFVWQNQRLYNNNCGPATLSIALSYWGLEDDQTITAANLKPHPEDRNVMPYEMVDYVRTQTNLNATLRWGGDLEMIKKFVAAGFPVVIERGFEEEVPQGYWMGHYGVISGYDDSTETLIVQDSFVGPNYERPYDFIERHWRAFNYAYIVIYPPHLEVEIFTILGPHANETYNLQHAAEKAQQETTVNTGRELFFAWFNYGTSLVGLNDYHGAAQAYDQAYTVLNEVYPGLDPLYRILWYQTGPYFAYFYTQRYEEVVELADKTLRSSFVPAIEETWVWRGRAKVELGDTEGGIEDFRTALEWHPGWGVAQTELRKWE